MNRKRKKPAGKPKKRPIRRRKRKRTTPIVSDKLAEYVVSFSYKTGRMFDVIVTAETEDEALEEASTFLATDPNGMRIVQSGFTNWEMEAARGKRATRHRDAEYQVKKRRMR